MKKRFINKSIIIGSIVLGVLVSLQLKIINIENRGMTTFKRGEQLTEELKSLKKEKENLQSEINSVKKDIDTYRGKSEKGEQDILQSEIEKYETLAGYTDVEGKGIEVEINSTKTLGSFDKNDSILYNYDLLLSMINKLNSAQASAISINNQRLVSNTYMYLKEDKLYMNDTVIKEPITIKAIGDSDTLASALNIKYGIVWEIETYYNAKVKVTKEDNVKINGHGDTEKVERK
ncbi:DUF881 domain-containing protein [Clostridioides sp. ZZV13-5731]|uniref:DUF881 domain-containing protein n=1 Tax=Clostridioides sp. ZZV13-5731 TaxID=2811485 RepID=UPI001D112D80|nr:DUF881 domain-containing protein [Clostridioides sp. ZZV13-5731]